MNKENQRRLEQYFEKWKERETLRLAISKCPVSPKEKFNSLVNKKQSVDKELESLKNNILPLFSKENGCIALEKPWCLLCYKANGKGEILVFPLQEKKTVAKAWEFASKVKQLKPEKTMRNYTDEPFLQKFFQQLSLEAKSLVGENKKQEVMVPKGESILLSTLLSPTCGDKKDSAQKKVDQLSPIVHVNAEKQNLLKKSSLAITEHAYLRWMQRVVGDGKHPSKEQVIKDIKKDFSGASFIYHKERDDTYFFLNKESMVVYCVKGKTLASLWKNEFGFADEVNRATVFAQIDFLIKEKDSFSKENGRLLGLISQNNVSCESAKTEIAGIKAEIERLNSIVQERESFIEQSKEENKLLLNRSKELDEKLAEQENVLFKKFSANFDREEEDLVDLTVIGTIEGEEDVRDKLSILGLFNGKRDNRLHLSGNTVKRCFAESTN